MIVSGNINVSGAVVIVAVDGQARPRTLLEERVSRDVVEVTEERASYPIFRHNGYDVIMVTGELDTADAYGYILRFDPTDEPTPPPLPADLVWLWPAALFALFTAWLLTRKKG